MPYKNPEHKRQWERVHREQRNEQRSMRRLQSKTGVIARNPAPDPASCEQGKSGWTGIIAFGAAVAAVAIAMFSGVNIPGRQGASPDIGS